MLIEMSKEVSISTPYEKLNFLVFPIITYLLRVIQLFCASMKRLYIFLMLEHFVEFHCSTIKPGSFLEIITKMQAHVGQLRHSYPRCRQYHRGSGASYE